MSKEIMKEKIIRFLGGVPNYAFDGLTTMYSKKCKELEKARCYIEKLRKEND